MMPIRCITIFPQKRKRTSSEEITNLVFMDMVSMITYHIKLHTMSHFTTHLFLSTIFDMLPLTNQLIFLTTTRMMQLV